MKTVSHATRLYSYGTTTLRLEPGSKILGVIGNSMGVDLYYEQPVEPDFSQSWLDFEFRLVSPGEQIDDDLTYLGIVQQQIADSTFTAANLVYYREFK